MKTTIKLLSGTILLAAALIVGCDRATEEQRASEKGKQGATERKSERLDLAGNSNSEPSSSEEDNYKFEDGTFRANSNGNVLGNQAVGWGPAEKSFISSSAAVEDNKDTTRKFIRTADMRFRVKNVLQATYSIESIAKQFDGFVTYTHLASTIDKRTVTPVSADSSLETIHYTVDNNITLRVPNTRLDTALKTISRLIDYLDYRTIKAEDVALQMLANKLAQDRAAQSGKRIEAAIDDQGRKLKETTAAEELLSQRKAQKDAARIAYLELQDKINFSTITLNIYQRQTLKRELIENDKNIDAYKPGFGTQIVNALKWGWHLLEAVFVFIARLWGLILIGVLGYILYRVLIRKGKI